jgi:hypothetical protein
MNLKISNLRKPSHKKFKMYADYILYSVLPALASAVLLMPISDSAQKWLIYGLTILGIALKGLSKFSSEGLTEVEEEIEKGKQDGKEN